MSTPMLMIDHPTEETLAAFVDHRLEGTARQETTQHLADCGECRELVLMATDFQQSEKVVVTGRFGNGRIARIAASIAIAAGLAVVFLPQWSTPDIDDVRIAARKLSRRTTDGRVSGLSHQQEPERLRSASERKSEVSADLLNLAAQLEKSRDRHAFGASLLWIASTPDEMNDAIAALDAAFKSARPEQRDAIGVDLAAALIGRGRWSGGEKGLERAFQLSDEMYRRTRSPEAAWNRAIALELLNRDADAITAWDDYLKLDQTSEWANEARRRRSLLAELTK